MTFVPGNVVDTIRTGSKLQLVLDGDGKVETEFVSMHTFIPIEWCNPFCFIQVICAGTLPNVEIAQAAGLPINKDNGGLIVEPTLEVCPDLYAAGDIISWYIQFIYLFENDYSLHFLTRKDPIFKTHRRVDHHDHALTSGHVAGKNMSGLAIEYNHQPFFWYVRYFQIRNEHS